MSERITRMECRVSSGHLSRVLVVHNRDYEGADADPENRARADVLSTAEGVRAALERLGHPVELLGIGGDLDGLTRRDRCRGAGRRLQSV